MLSTRDHRPRDDADGFAGRGWWTSGRPASHSNEVSACILVGRRNGIEQSSRRCARVRPLSSIAMFATWVIYETESFLHQAMHKRSNHQSARFKLEQPFMIRSAYSKVCCTPEQHCHDPVAQADQRPSVSGAAALQRSSVKSCMRLRQPAL